MSDVYLAPLNSNDSAKLFAWINDPKLVQFNAPYKPVTDLQHQTWFEQITRASHGSIFAIRLHKDDRLIGSCQLFNFNDIARSAELQIRVGEVEFQSQGLGTQALQLLLDYGFSTRNLHRIYLHVFSNNERARKAYEKIGFKQEGCLRQAAFINGAYVDILVMGILRHEYENLNVKTT